MKLFRSRLSVLFAVLVYTSTPAYSAAILPQEVKIKDFVEQQKIAQRQFLQKLVNIDSGTLNQRGVHRVGAIVVRELKQLGFHIVWVNEPSAMHRAGTLIASHKGSSANRILLIGHLDTVFLKQSTSNRYTEKKFSAKGRGVIDDKGGVVVLIYALKALKASGELKNLNITVVLTGDEEDSGKPAAVSRKPLLQAAAQSDVALDFEPAITLHSATIARRGITMWTLTTHGNPSHSATIFQKNVGVGAIFGMANLLDVMRTKLQNKPNVSFNPGMIMGGSTVNYNSQTASAIVTGKENIVAGIAAAIGDLRYLDERQKQSVETAMREMITHTLPEVKAELEFVDGIPPMTPTAQNKALLEQYSQVSMDLDQGKVTALAPGIRGAGDISYVAGVVPANLSGLGPVGYGPHTSIESIELNSLPIQTERAAILILRTAKKSSSSASAK